MILIVNNNVSISKRPRLFLPPTCRLGVKKRLITPTEEGRAPGQVVTIDPSQESEAITAKRSERHQRVPAKGVANSPEALLTMMTTKVLGLVLLKVFFLLFLRV